MHACEMPKETATSPSPVKRVRFGGVTVIPIPRRGAVRLSLSPDSDDPLVAVCATPARQGEHVPTELPSQPWPDESLTAQTVGVGDLSAESLSLSRSPSIGDSQQPFTSAQLAYLQPPPVPSPPLPQMESPTRSMAHRVTSCSPASYGIYDSQSFAAALDNFLGVTEDSPPRPATPADASPTSPLEEPLARVSVSASAARGSCEVVGEAASAVEPPRTVRRLEIDKSSAAEVAPAQAPPLPHVCVFCGGGAIVDTTDGERKGDDPQPGCLMAQDGLCFHAACALWCPEVYTIPRTGTLANIAEAWERSRDIKCVVCRRGGAAVGCACEDCQLSYHLPCALNGGTGVALDTREFALYCPRHKRLAAVHDEEGRWPA